MFQNAKIHRDVTPFRYHAWNDGRTRGKRDWVISRSELLHMEHCGEYFMAGGPEVDSDSVRLGDLVDCLLLTPHEFEERFAVQPLTYVKEVPPKPWNKRANICKQWHEDNPGQEPPKTYAPPAEEKKWSGSSDTCKEWIASQKEAGKTVVNQRMITLAQGVCNAVRTKQVFAGLPVPLRVLIEQAEKQIVVTAEWRDPDTGATVPCRAMLDLVRNLESPHVSTVIYDLKTAKDIRKRQFGFSVHDHGYDVQAWMYSSMLAAALDTQGEEIPFGIIAVRNSYPFLVATYRAGHGAKDDFMMLDTGQDRFRRCMSKYILALQKGFDGYTNGFEEL